MKANMKTNMKPNMMANMKANMKAIMKANMKANVLSVCSYRPISAVSLLLSYWLFFERSISHPARLTCSVYAAIFLLTHPTEFLLSLQIH